MTPRHAVAVTRVHADLLRGRRSGESSACMGTHRRASYRWLRAGSCSHRAVLFIVVLECTLERALSESLLKSQHFSEHFKKEHFKNNCVSGQQQPLTSLVYRVPWLQRLLLSLV